jgi:hypothetical protein
MDTMTDARMVRLPFTRSFPRASAPLDVVHIDVTTVRKQELPSDVDGRHLGMKYAVVFVDDYSRMKKVYFCKAKKDVPSLVRLYLLEVGSHALYGSAFVMHNGFRQMRIHTDGGKELNSATMEKVLLEFGLSANVTSAPHTPASNGVAERAIQTLQVDAAARLAMSKLPARYWHWAMRHACAARNKLASQRLTYADGSFEWTSPYELFHGRRPDVRHTVTFGSPCRVLLQGPERLWQGKMGLPGARGYVLGHGCDGVQIDGTYRLILGYIVLLRTGSVVFSRHVEIDERALVEGGHQTPFDKDVGDQAAPNEDDHQEEEEDEGEQRQPEGEQRQPAAQRARPAERAPARAPQLTAPPPPLEPIPEEEGMQALPDEMRRGHDPLRLDRASRSKTAARARQLRGRVRAAASTPDVKVPNNYKEAMTSPQAEMWAASMKEHLQGHEQLSSFVEVIIPAKQRAIPTRWVYALKTDADGNITRFKSRFVIKGFMQRAGIDYDEVFSPTIRGEQIRLMLAVGARQCGERMRVQGGSEVAVLGKGDVTNAYLTAPLPPEEVVLFELPEGYVPKLRASEGHRVVARSVKAQQGLKQSGRVWNGFQHSCLTQKGFEQCVIAPCIYLKKLERGYILVGIFVDDILFVNMSDVPNAIEREVLLLSEHYEVKFTSKLEKFLGAQFDETEVGIVMHHSQKIKEMMERFGVAEDEVAATPEVPDVAGQGGAEDEALLLHADKKEFQAVTGAIMYTMTSCRPDIAHAANTLARRMGRPRVKDMKTARRVLAYLNGTQHIGLLFKYKMDKSDHEGLLAYADSDWANDPDERRSTSGYVILFNGTPISWMSGLQTVVALSSCEAEYVALSECCREVAYLRQLMDFLHEPVHGPTTIYEDNQGTIDLTNNPVHHKRTKHIDVKYHFVREAQSKGDVLVAKVHTDNNCADIFTKATAAPTFHRHVRALMFCARARDR